MFSVLNRLMLLISALLLAVALYAALILGSLSSGSEGLLQLTFFKELVESYGGLAFAPVPLGWLVAATGTWMGLGMVVANFMAILGCATLHMKKTNRKENTLVLNTMDDPPKEVEKPIQNRVNTSCDSEKKVVVPALSKVTEAEVEKEEAADIQTESEEKPQTEEESAADPEAESKEEVKEEAASPKANAEPEEKAEVEKEEAEDPAEAEPVIKVPPRTVVRTRPLISADYMPPVRVVSIKRFEPVTSQKAKSPGAAKTASGKKKSAKVTASKPSAAKKSVRKPGEATAATGEDTLPVPRKHVLLNRRTAVNMFSDYLAEKTEEEKERLEGKINTVIIE